MEHRASAAGSPAKKAHDGHDAPAQAAPLQAGWGHAEAFAAAAAAPHPHRNWPAERIDGQVLGAEAEAGHPWHAQAGGGQALPRGFGNEVPCGERQAWDERLFLAAYDACCDTMDLPPFEGSQQHLDYLAAHTYPYSGCPTLASFAEQQVACDLFQGAR